MNMTEYKVNPKFDNDNIVDKTSFEMCVGLIHKVCKQVHVRVEFANLSFEYDDLYQEACLVWIKARERFNPELGNRFSTYLVRSLYNELNRKLKKQDDNVDEHAFSYCQKPTHGGVIGLTLESVLQGSHVSVEDEEVAYESMNTFEADLSVFARLTLKHFVTPSKELVSEFNMLKEKVELSKQHGYARRLRPEIDLSFVSSFISRILGKSEKHARSVRKEIESKAEFHLA